MSLTSDLVMSGESEGDVSCREEESMVEEVRDDS